MLVDRAKDMIIRGGENIYPREIEAVVHQLPADRRGRGGRAARVRSTAKSPRCSSQLHPGRQLQVDRGNPRSTLHKSPSKYKLPVEITILDELPKNAVGKIAKRSLRQRFANTH